MWSIFCFPKAAFSILKISVLFFHFVAKFYAHTCCSFKLAAFLHVLELQIEQYILVLNKALCNKHTLQHCFKQEVIWQRLVYLHLVAEVLSSNCVISWAVQKLFDWATYIYIGHIKKGENSCSNLRMLLFQIQNNLICL